MNQFQNQPFGWPSFLFVPPIPTPAPLYRCPTFVDDSDISITVGPPGPPGPPGSLIVPVTIVNDSNYNATVDDYYIGVNFAGASSVVLPASVDGRTYIVKDVSGAAFTNPITVTASTTIDGETSYVLNSNFASITLVFNGVEWSIV